MPAFTTNVEFGYYLAKDKNRVVYGRPNEAVKTRYLDWLYNIEKNQQPFNNLDDMLTHVLNQLK